MLDRASYRRTKRAIGNAASDGIIPALQALPGRISEHVQDVEEKRA